MELLVLLLPLENPKDLMKLLIITVEELIGVLNLNLVEELKNAAAGFWTSIGQYHLYKNYLPKPFLHLCPSGETAQQLKAEGLEPIEFPNIKAFASWRKNLKD